MIWSFIICKNPMKTYTFAFVNSFCILLIIFFILIQFFVAHWFSQGKGRRSWTGSLLYKSDQFYINISCSKQEIQFCDGLYNLWKAGVLYLIFEIFAFIALVFSLLVLKKMFFENKKYLVFLIGSVFIACFLHGFGYFYWAFLVNLSFSTECFPDYRNDLNANVCVKFGAVIGLIVFVFMVLLVFQMVVVWKFHFLTEKIQPEANHKVSISYAEEEKQCIDIEKSTNTEQAE